jgi:hypothetical protein
MIEPRIYRAAFLPALFAVVVAMFSVETQPRALPQGLASDVLFEGSLAADTLRDIALRTPDRRPGSNDDIAAANRVRSTFRQSGFATTYDRFDDDGVPLVNVVGRRPGLSRRQIVVMAARDSAHPPDAPGSAADTAALLEMARVFEGRASNKTLVLASVDGSTRGDAGARRFPQTAGSPDLIDAVIVVSNLAANRSSGPLLVAWSNDPSRGSIGLARTVADAARSELGTIPNGEGVFSQFARLSVPIAPGAQGVLLPDGIEALRVSGSGELGPRKTGLADIDTERYGALGRAVLNTVSALDQSPPPKHGPDAYVTFAGKVLPAWTIQLVALSLTLPALVASIDALARARRRRQPVGRWAVWVAAGLVPFALALVMADFFVLVGLADDAPPAPLDPRLVTLDLRAVAALVATAFVAALAWVLARSSVIRRAGSLPDPSAPGAACVASLGLSVFCLVLALINPFAALLMVPAVHLWLLATLADVRPPASLALFLAGLVPGVGVTAYYAFRFDLAPPREAYYGFLLVTGGAASPLAIVGGCVLFALFGAVASIVLARVRADRDRERDHREQAPTRPRITGPAGHAGPGAIGGPQSIKR